MKNILWHVKSVCEIHILVSIYEVLLESNYPCSHTYYHVRPAVWGSGGRDDVALKDLTYLIYGPWQKQLAILCLKPRPWYPQSMSTQGSIVPSCPTCFLPYSHFSRLDSFLTNPVTQTWPRSGCQLLALWKYFSPLGGGIIYVPVHLLTVYLLLKNVNWGHNVWEGRDLVNPVHFCTSKVFSGPWHTASAQQILAE